MSLTRDTNPVMLKLFLTFNISSDIKSKVYHKLFRNAFDCWIVQKSLSLLFSLRLGF